MREVWFDGDLERTGIVAEIVNLAMTRSVPLVEVSQTRFDRVVRSETSQGVIAFAEPLRDLTVAELVASCKGIPKLVVLDHINDPRNLGAILRSAECAGFQGAILPEKRSTKITASVTKAAAGAVEHLNFALVPGIPAALEELKSLGVWTVGLDPQGSVDVGSVNLFSGPVALVLGSEGKGLSRLVRERCDLLASIKQYGKIESLNVSAAATVAFFAVASAQDRRQEP